MIVGQGAIVADNKWYTVTLFLDEDNHLTWEPDVPGVLTATLTMDISHRGAPSLP